MISLKKMLLMPFAIFSVFQTCVGMEEIPENIQSSDISEIFNIKDTYQVIQEQYKHLSLIHGAIAWETGFIRRLYDFGEIAFKTKVVGEEPHQNTVIDAYLPGGHDTVRLVHAFFSRPFETTSIPSFSVTKQLKNVTDETIINACAELLFNCNQLRVAIGQCKDSVEKMRQVLPNLNMRDHLMALIDGTCRDSAIIKQAEHAVKVKNMEVTKENIKLAKKEIRSSVSEIFQNAPKATLKKIALLLRQSAEVVASILGDVALLSMQLEKKPQIKQALLGSITESLVGEEAEEDNDMLYLPHTTEMVILGFMYKKFGHSKKQFMLFYQKLHALFEKKFLARDLSSEWADECYKPVLSEDAKKSLKLLFEQDEAECCEDILFNSTQIFVYPKPNGDQTVKFVHEGTTISVPDCMDNAVRNFIRLLAYDPKKLSFSIEKLESCGFENVNEKLKQFLNRYTKPQDDNSYQAHAAWLGVISNIDYVYYATAFFGGRCIDATYEGLFAFIKTPTLDNKLVLGSAIKQANNGCEVKAGVRNLILILNHLMGLDLFNEKKMAEEVTRKDFIKEYFPLFCQKLGCVGLLATTQGASKQSEELSIFDKCDFDRNKAIFTTLAFPAFTCQFITRPGHAEMLMSSHEHAVARDVPYFFSVPSLGLLSASLSNCTEIQKIDYDNPYRYLYAVPLEDKLLTEALIRKIVLQRIIRSTRIDGEPIMQLMLRVIAKYPDVNEQERLNLSLMKSVVGAGCVFAYPLATKIVASALINGGNETTGFELLTELVKQKYKKAYKIALEATEKVVVSVNFGFKELNLIELLIELVKQKYEKAYKIALGAAEKAIVGNGYDIKESGLKLLTELVKQKYEKAYKIALEMAEKVIAVEIDSFREWGLELFEALFKQKQGIDVAQKIIYENKANLNKKAQETIKALSQMIEKYSNL